MRPAFTAVAISILAALGVAGSAQAAITIGPATVTSTSESGSLSFTVTRDAAIGADATLKVSTVSADATAGQDFTAVSRTVTLGAGLIFPTTQTFTVPILVDNLDEADESFTVALSEVSPNESIGVPASATGVITDDDPSPTVSVAPAAVAEGTGGATTLAVPVTLSAVSGRAVSVAYATADATAIAPGDYTAATGTLTIPAGQAGGTVAVPVTPDALDEDDETFTVTLSRPANATLATAKATATATITDDDTTVVAVPSGQNTGAIVVPANQLGTIVTAPGLTAPLPGLAVTTRKRVGLGRLMFARATGRMRFTVSCPVGAGRCKGTVTVFSVPARRSRVRALRREQQLASRRFDVAQGTRAKVTLSLSSKARGWLRSARRVKITAYAVSRDARGAPSTAKVAGTLRR